MITKTFFSLPLERRGGAPEGEWGSSILQAVATSNGWGHVRLPHLQRPPASLPACLPNWLAVAGWLASWPLPTCGLYVKK